MGPWGLIEPRAAWVTVILIAGIGFFNYMLWKLYGTRGTELSGFFGGLVNSNITVIELSSRMREMGATFAGTAYRGVLLAMAAMIARNGTLLALIAPAALLGAALPLALMLAASALLVAWSMHRRRRYGGVVAPELHMDMPFSLPQALKYGAIFLVLHIAGALTQRQFGDAGFYAVSIIGGVFSSASAVAAAATLAEQGGIPPATAGVGAILASFTSMAFSLSFVLRMGDRSLIRSLVMSMVAVAVSGAVGLLLGIWYSRGCRHWSRGWRRCTRRRAVTVRPPYLCPRQRSEPPVGFCRAAAVRSRSRRAWRSTRRRSATVRISSCVRYPSPFRSAALKSSASEGRKRMPTSASLRDTRPSPSASSMPNHFTA